MAAQAGQTAEGLSEPEMQESILVQAASTENAGQIGCVIGSELVIWSCFISVPGWICTSDLLFSGQARSCF
jgi:hypothetical protein